MWASHFYYIIFCKKKHILRGGPQEKRDKEGEECRKRERRVKNRFQWKEEVRRVLEVRELFRLVVLILIVII